MQKNPEEVSCIALNKVGYANHSKYHIELSKKVFEHICNFLANGYANKTNKNVWLKAVEDWNESNNFKIKNGFKNPYNNEITYIE